MHVRNEPSKTLHTVQTAGQNKTNRLLYVIRYTTSLSLVVSD